MSEHECFWESGCSDSRRCKAAGLCVAAAQNALSRNGSLEKQLAARDAKIAAEAKAEALEEAAREADNRSPEDS